MEMVFVKPLCEVIPRLDMLGFTPEFTREEFARCSNQWREHRSAMAEYDDSRASVPCHDLMSFDEFCSFATEHAVEDLDDTFAYTDHVRHENVIHGRFRDDGRLARLPLFSDYDHGSYSEQSYFGSLINILHPFSGAGNLLKFAEGLAKIDVHNQVIFVFDNDAEGYSTFQRLARLQLPINMRAMLLPELDAFRSFSVRGPEGISAADINRRAAGIECYLDLGFENVSPPRVLWTTYMTDLDLYQGALERKESYVKDFVKQ